jgi:XTP/dITP diphosphohydrolase
MPESNEICFATSNSHKFKEAEFILRGSGLRLTQLPSKGVEVQSDDVSEIARIAASSAFATYRRRLFVEDTGLSIAALNGFPGTYAAYVYRTIGLEGVLRLLGGAKDRTAEFVSAVAFCDGRAETKVFVGRLRGTIVAADTGPSGAEGFGYDPIFIPEGSRVTLGEMSMAEKCEISHRSRAIRSFASWATVSGIG